MIELPICLFELAFPRYGGYPNHRIAQLDIEPSPGRTIFDSPIKHYFVE